MTKEEHIAWWRDEALKTWETAECLVSGEQYVSALFFFHLTIEKLLKAIWVKDNIDNHPPRIHNLEELYNQTELKLPNGKADYLSLVTGWNIEGRYPDYKRKIYDKADTAYITGHQANIKELMQCLLDAL